MSSPVPSAAPSLPRLFVALALAALACLGLASGASAAAGQGLPGELTVLLQLSHPQGLASYVRAVSDPRSPDYREYMTVEEIVARFGASPADRASTLQWLTEHGAHGRLGATGAYVTARVPAAIARSAMPALGATASSLGGVSNARRIPATLRGAVTSISTLDPSPDTFKNAIETAAKGGASGKEPGYEGSSILANTGTQSGCPAGRTAGIPELGYALTPNEYLDAYGHSALHRRGFKGQGEKVAVVEIDGFRRSDVDTFAECFGLPSPNLRVHTVAIPKRLPPGGETTLDLEVLAATAPKLDRIDVYEGGGAEGQVLESFAAALGTKGHRPDAISISLGDCEADLTRQVAFREVLDEAFAVAGGAGISVLVAAGDSGSSGCQRETEAGKTALPLLAASDPATSPWVTAVGGTSIALSKANKIKQEPVWNDAPVGFGAGGGGFSILATPRPWWQEGLLEAAGNGRIVPDVAGLADPAPGYAIYCTAPDCVALEPSLPEGGWLKVGGTSAATPLYAGGVLLADDYQARHGAPALGFLNPLVYELGRESRSGKGGGVLSDVTLGNDDLGPSEAADAGGGASLGCCTAFVGYDAASGWGSLDVASLAKVAAGRFGRAQRLPRLPVPGAP